MNLVVILVRAAALAALVPIMVVLLACADGASPDVAGDAFEVVDSAGVALVLNHDAGPEGFGSLEVVEDLRLGAMDGEREELLFHGIHDIVLDGDERIFVANNQTGTVRLFDQDGTFVREFGGKGEGPSEIPSMLNDLIRAGDEIALIDWQRGGKTILYDTAGTFRESWRDTRPDGERYSLSGYTPEGWLSIEISPYPDDPRPGGVYERRSTMRRFVSPDSLGEALFELSPNLIYGTEESEGLDWALFDPVEAWGFDGDGNIYQSAGVDYRIDVISPDGELLRSIRRDVRGIPITDADVEAYKDDVRLQYDTASRGDAARRQEQLERYLARIDEQATLPMPEVRPRLGQMLVAHSGAIWVERVDFREPSKWWQERMTGGFGSTPTSETSWDLLDLDGRFVGNVVLPPRFLPLAASDRSVVGLLADDFDVEHVVRFRIVGEGGT